MLFYNATALIGSELTSNVDVRIENDHIVSVHTSMAEPSHTPFIDATNLILAPGFVDIHIHGYGNHDTMNGKQHILTMSKGLLKHGVTSFLPTTMAAPIPQTHEVVKACYQLMDTSFPAVGSRILGCHLEGPFLNPAKNGAQPAQYIIPASLEAYRQIVGNFETTVRLVTLAPEPLDDNPDTLKSLLYLIRHISLGAAVSAGHSETTGEQLGDAIACGLSQVTHLFNAMPPLHHRKFGLIDAALANPGIGVQIIADKLHLHPNILKLVFLAKGRERTYLITDAMEATGMPDGEYMLGANHVTVKDREARLADGTLAGSTLTMDQAVRNMVSSTAATPADALYMASTAPANAIGEGKRGRIKAGAFADLLLLTPDLTIDRVFVEGKLAHPC